MKSNFEIEGLDKVQKEIKKLQKKIKKVGGKRNVRLVDLLTDSFVKKNSKYNSLQDMVDSYPKEINLEKDFSNKEWNEYVRENSKFNSWEEMLHAGYVEWVKKKLNF